MARHAFLSLHIGKLALQFCYIFRPLQSEYSMSWKKEIDRPLDAEQAKNLELDETPEPTRKVSNPSTPAPDSAEPSTHDRIKGRRVKK